MLQLLANPSSLGRVVPPTTTSVTAVPTFAPFDSTSELWKDCSSRFLTFTRAHSVPDDRKAQVFLTNQSLTVCIIRFQILPHKKRYRGKSTILHWIRLWLHEGAIGSDAFRHPGAFQVLDYHATSTRGSIFKSWLHPHVKKRPCAILLPLPTPWTKHYVCASFAR